MSIVLVGSSSGSITLQEPAVAGTTTLNLPATSGTVVVTGTTPTLNGITFPATQVPSADANTLDDYEEGTWTPVVSADSSVPTGVTYSSRSGFYRKVGQLVTVTLRVVVNNYGTGGSGAFQMSGLPFTCLAIGFNIPCGGFYMDNPTMPSGRTWAVPQAIGNTANISMIAAGNGASATTMQYSQISAGNDISIGLTYFSAS
jgi:hypothetical protein